MKMTLYHGTCDNCLDKIFTEGLIDPYLTNSLDLAKYYAEVSSEENEGNEVVLEVTVDTNMLRIDDNSMCEPVSFDEYSTYELEEIVQDKYNDLAKKHPELISKHNTIIVPEHLYKVSLDTVASCWHKGIVLPKDILISTGSYL